MQLPVGQWQLWVDCLPVDRREDPRVLGGVSGGKGLRFCQKPSLWRAEEGGGCCWDPGRGKSSSVMSD